MVRYFAENVLQSKYQNVLVRDPPPYYVEHTNSLTHAAEPSSCLHQLFSQQFNDAAKDPQQPHYQKFDAAVELGGQHDYLQSRKIILQRDEQQAPIAYLIKRSNQNTFIRR